MQRCLIVSICALATATNAASDELEALVKHHAEYYNVSISVAITLDATSETIAAAHGAADRGRGTPVTVSSQYPGGSVTKTFTAVAALKLVEAGKLDLDVPFHRAVDPWLQAQGMPTLLQMFNGDRTIEYVTARQLLHMRSGIRDYNDGQVRQWTLDHPDEDFLPLQFVQSVTNSSKPAFYFLPDTGGTYSGVAYVLSGWVLAAASGASSWDELAQQAIIEAPRVNSSLPPFKFEHARFMNRGPCSQYSLPPVVHQYLYDPVRSKRGLGAAPAHCATPSPSTWYTNTHLLATAIGEQAVAEGGAAACCALADSFVGATYWEFVSNQTSATVGTCTFYSGYAHGYLVWHNATSGRADGVVSEEQFVDLYSTSCLNGWTMGNIAAAPSDITRFYHALFGGQLLSPRSVAQMMEWMPLTVGFSTGTPYGLGLMLQNVQATVDHSCGRLPDCFCAYGKCEWNTQRLNHVGVDYGSGFYYLGYLPSLGVSFAIATNTGEQPMGMNSTIGVLENQALLSAGFRCELMQVVIDLALPEEAPTLICNS